ncbi:DNA methyltransferase [Cetobacterium sp.]|uniref:DNA methyltransferase n=1 Tax=Cetobacterium sp. TaxID=2071632 RepID=UPI003F313628
MSDLIVLNDKEQKAAAKSFAEFWKDKGYEKGESQPFWLSLLRDVLGIQHPEQYINFESKVKLDNTSFIDGYISETHVLIEQKSLGKNLRQPIKQSDGTKLSPFQQAKRYSSELSYSERPRWIVICNFEEFHIYDMENPRGEPEVIFLKDFPKEYYRLQFLINSESEHIKKEMEISLKAGEIVGEFYEELLKQYRDGTSEKALKSLNMLCVRLVFCLYAEDAGVFGAHGKFHDYLKQYEVKDIRRAIIDLFKILNTKEEERDPYLDSVLLSFPYVNGGLFADEDIEIPNFTDRLRNLILKNASEDFDWSEISPTIFGAVFESTLNPETRRSGGMHYTSIQNIHKVIDPLFLNELKEEFSNIKLVVVEKTKIKKLMEFQEKLSSLNFLDPACGSGNFLTQTYIEIRKLENEVLKTISGKQMFLDTGNIIKVKINQFHGIEINDFAVTVGKTALWIAESQMMKKTEELMSINLDFLPLKSYPHIVEGNALQMDWEEVISKDKLNYIMGNPPFVGKKEQTKEQKAELILLFEKKIKGIGNLDYVAGWYKKAIDYMQESKIMGAFVSTNSIVQGEQVPILWKELLKLDIIINFAYQPFKWESEIKNKAAVHCVIVGFSCINKKDKFLFANDSQVRKVDNINPYLLDAETVIIENRNSQIDNRPNILYGNMPIDDGNLILSKDEVEELLKENPKNEILIKKYMGGNELINNRERWCLWLKNINPKTLRESKIVSDRIMKTKIFRENSNRPQTKALADTPYLFGEIRQPNTKMLVVPKVSSENRKYIPLAFINPEIIVNGSALIIPNADLYELGILISNVHMAWMRIVCGRMKSDYQYSGSVVYNNFPWCESTDKQKEKIEMTAQAILDARNLYPESSLADLYDELTMPAELRKAHQQNDKAVMEAYGFPVKTDFTESMCVAKLMEMYKEKIEKIKK